MKKRKEDDTITQVRVNAEIDRASHISYLSHDALLKMITQNAELTTKNPFVFPSLCEPNETISQWISEIEYAPEQRPQTKKFDKSSLSLTLN